LARFQPHIGYKTIVVVSLLVHLLRVWIWDFWDTGLLVGVQLASAFVAAAELLLERLLDCGHWRVAGVEILVYDVVDMSMVAWRWAALGGFGMLLVAELLLVPPVLRCLALGSPEDKGLFAAEMLTEVLRPSG
jgi:hypothetical protein